MENHTHFELIVIGAGPAGMAAAWSAGEAGVQKILVVDRNAHPGGILPQCIHDGFGLYLHEKSVSGPEYAEIWREKLSQQAIDIVSSTTITLIDYNQRPFVLSYTSKHWGAGTFTADAIVLATGCREKTLGQMKIPGSRPAGIYTAGAAQYMMNMQNYLPGKSAVILGSGDIGLIMARRLTLEGVQVKLILGEKASGLARNYVQCVADFQLPIRFGYTLLSTHGYQRLTGVTIAPVDETGKAIISQKQYIRCDTLLLATGLIPEAELWNQGQPEHDRHELTKQHGIAVNQDGATAVEGVFACGNVTQIYDLVDTVTVASMRTGLAAAQWITAQKGNSNVSEEKILSLKEQLPSFSVNELKYEKIADVADDQLVCIVCPRGCRLQISDQNGEAPIVSGYQCDKGKEYGLQEATEPKRILTTTVKINSADRPVIAVRSTAPIAKNRLRDAVKQINRITLEAPITLGQVICRNIVESGADMIIADGFAANSKASIDNVAANANGSLARYKTDEGSSQ